MTEIWADRPSMEANSSLHQNVIRHLTGLLVALFSLLVLAESCWAHPARASYGTAKEKIFKLDKSTRLRYAPVDMPGGSTLTLITPEQWMPLAYSLTESIEHFHYALNEIFGEIPSFKISLRLMEEEYFYKKTGAPRWTNAMFYRGQIIIPLSTTKATEMDNIERSIKHEYSHAVIHALSDGGCPGWLDEGFAQWIEGSENPALLPALTRWLKRKKPIPFSKLQGGFTGLDKDMVPVAYAQSLYSTRFIFQEYGIEHLKEYLSRLGKDESKESAFQETFDVSEKEFEKLFVAHVRKLAKKRAYKYK